MLNKSEHIKGTYTLLSTLKITSYNIERRQMSKGNSHTVKYKGETSKWKVNKQIRGTHTLSSIKGQEREERTS